MSFIYVTEQNTVLKKDGERLLINKGESTIANVHFFNVEKVILFGNVTVTWPAISELLSRGIDIVYLTKSGKYKGTLSGELSKNIPLRIEQFKKLLNPSFARITAGAIVKGKIFNSRTFLSKIDRSRPERVLIKETQRMKELETSIHKSRDVDSIRGIEGAASSLYFAGFGKCVLRPEFGFPGRVRRPPTDPINALLSLGYTLLYSEIRSMIYAIGLDPFLGCLHFVEYGKPSLALDLMEEWRSVLVDSLVLSLINLKVLDPDDFVEVSTDDLITEDRDLITDVDKSDPNESVSPKPVRLTEPALKKFLNQYEKKMLQTTKHHLLGKTLTYRECIREQIRHFARYIKGEDEVYIPFTIR